MNRISKTVASLGNGKLLIPFFTAGFPDFKRSLELVVLAEQAGANMVELGLPFSDPMADGPEIQFSSKTALDKGMSLKKILSGVVTLRKKTQIPLILMGYYNPIHAFGPEKFLSEAAFSGVDGLIVPDLPIDEALHYKKAADNAGISTVFLAAPTSPPDRLALIDRLSSDFVYAVTVTGVTGSGKVYDRSTDNYLKGLKRTLTRRFVAGFGVSSAETARRLTRYADGVVIGSRLMKIMREARSAMSGVKSVEKLLSAIRKVI
jgi:tryptophan synthase alpha chain